jgi:hypothetical protein
MPVRPQQQFDERPCQGPLNVSATETPKLSFAKRPPPSQLYVSRKNTLKPPFAKRSPSFMSEINALQNLSRNVRTQRKWHLGGVANWISVPRIGFC